MSADDRAVRIERIGIGYGVTRADVLWLLAELQKADAEIAELRDHAANWPDWCHELQRKLEAHKKRWAALTYRVNNFGPASQYDLNMLTQEAGL